MDANARLRDGGLFLSVILFWRRRLLFCLSWHFCLFDWNWGRCFDRLSKCTLFSGAFSFYFSSQLLIRCRSNSRSLGSNHLIQQFLSDRRAKLICRGRRSIGGALCSLHFGGNLLFTRSCNTLRFGRHNFGQQLRCNRCTEIIRRHIFTTRWRGRRRRCWRGSCGGCRLAIGHGIQFGY